MAPVRENSSDQVKSGWLQTPRTQLSLVVFRSKKQHAPSPLSPAAATTTTTDYLSAVWLTSTSLVLNWSSERCKSTMPTKEYFLSICVSPLCA